MSTEQMRTALIYRCVYSSEEWKKKVEAMSDHQVLAIYDSFRHRGKLVDYPFSFKSLQKDK